MSVKICGHRVQCNKTIKIYTFLGRSVTVFLLCLLFTLPVFAAEKKGAAQLQEITPAAGVVPPKTEMRTPPTVPAMALILALGLRNVQGPMEHASTAPSAAIKVVKK